MDQAAPKESWCSKLVASVWWPIVLKGGGFALLLAGLGLLGSGAVDRWLTPRTAAAANQVPTAHSAPWGHGGKPRRAAQSAEVESASSVEAVAIAAPAGSASSPPAGPASAVRTSDGKLILNVATEKDLDALPGVGAAKAKAIVELRTKLGGRFKRLEELMRVKGIKRKFLERIRPLVVLDAPAA